MRRLLLTFAVVLAACGDSGLPYEKGLSKRLGFVEIGSSQVIGFCSIGIGSGRSTGTVNFRTPTPPEEVKGDLVRAGGTITSTEKDRVTVTLGEDTYTIVDRKPTSVDVRFVDRTQPAACSPPER